jgi:hypothetical protein
LIPRRLRRARCPEGSRRASARLRRLCQLKEDGRRRGRSAISSSANRDRTRCRIIIHTEKPSFKKVVVFIANLQIFNNGPSGRRASLPCMRMNRPEKDSKNPRLKVYQGLYTDERVLHLTG